MRNIKWLVLLLVTGVIIAACQPQTVEVTRVVTETVTETVVDQVEVTRIVEGESVTEMVEVTRVVEVEVPAEAPEEEAMEEEDMEPSSLRMSIDFTEGSSNPYTYQTGYPGWNILLLQYDTLMQLDLNGVPQPWLATNVETSEDGMTITMDLRDDVFWHDGEPFTAEDVKFTVEYYQEFNHGRWTRNMGNIDTAETDGDYRVILNMTAPSPGFESGTLADTPIIPQHIWDGVDDPDNHEFEANIGTGPYELVDMELDQFYVFEANQDYWAGEPQVDELVLVQFADIAGQLGALRTRAIDMMIAPVGPEQISVLGDLEGIDVIQGPEFTTTLINYDIETPPFDNKAFRQAMNLAIDRQTIIDTVYLGAATAGSAGWIHPAKAEFNPAVETVYDPEAAIALLEAEGFVDGDGDGIREFNGAPLSFEFIASSDNALALRIAEVASSMLAEVGIEANVVALEPATATDAQWPGFDVANGRNYEMAMFGWSAPAQAITNRITNLIHSDNGIGWLNLTGFNNERANELSDALLVEIDPEAELELVHEIQEIVADELPFILLLYPDGAYAYWTDIYDGWEFMTGQGVFHKLSFLPEDSRLK